MKVHTTIRTPQFKDGRVFEFVTQRGEISTVSWTFEPYDLVYEEDNAPSAGMHKVMFKDENDYLKHKVE